VTAYRTAFRRPQATLGRQQETIADTAIWVLPNPSGLNAHFQLDELGKLFRELREAVQIAGSGETRRPPRHYAPAPLRGMPHAL